MVSFLYSIDVAVFRWINESWSNSYLDSFFSFITNIHHFYLVIIPLIIYWVIWGGIKGRWLALSLFIGLLLSDQIASHVIKQLIERSRPCNVLPGVLTPDGPSNSFSFPSSHAANMGSSMFLLTMAFRPWMPLFMVIGLLVGLSRIYLGLHYPSDVLGGYALGLLLGYIVWWSVGKLKAQFTSAPKKAQKKIAPKKRGKRG